MGCTNLDRSLIFTSREAAGQVLAWVCQLCQGEEDFCYFWFLSLDNYCNWAILNLFHYFLLSFINSINFHSLIFITSINFCPLISLIFILSIIFHFYQPQSGMVMQKCRSKKRIKKGPMFFLVCMVIEPSHINPGCILPTISHTKYLLIKIS